MTRYKSNPAFDHAPYRKIGLLSTRNLSILGIVITLAFVACTTLPVPESKLSSFA